MKRLTILLADTSRRSSWSNFFYFRPVAEWEELILSIISGVIGHCRFFRMGIFFRTVFGIFRHGFQAQPFKLWPC